MLRTVFVVLVTAMVVVLTSCGGATTPTAAPSASQGGTFPATARHAFGETVVPAEPRRIVTVGLTEQDIVLALGVVPVGVTYWYADQPQATWPWARDRLGGSEPEVLRATAGQDFERIAALRPDLIIGVNAGLDQATYDRLSAIAPTVAHPEGGTAYFSAWDAQTRVVGAALGRPAQADALIGSVRELFARAAADHPEFAGLPAIFLQAPYYDGAAVAYPDGLSTAFLTDLGFTVPAAIDEFVPPVEASQALIPLERLDVLDTAKVLVFATEDQQARLDLEKAEGFRRLAVVRGGHLVYTDRDLAAAIYFATPLSLPYVLDRLVPQLSAALAGDPSTVPPL